MSFSRLGRRTGGLAGPSRRSAAISCGVSIRLEISASYTWSGGQSRPWSDAAALLISTNDKIERRKIVPAVALAALSARNRRRTTMPEGAAKPASLPPDLQIVEMVMAQFRSRLTHVAAALKLPDLLTDGPKSAAELAPVTGTNPRALHRAMRTMASLGFFTED